ncbi:unnamed protein product [Ilex paraguariensis]|uniref:F-box protein n=1 Tax=Ilex paraguariensis TaxID=185542 RepID=A0ABC8T3C3_9AQUA
MSNLSVPKGRVVEFVDDFDTQNGVQTITTSTHKLQLSSSNPRKQRTTGSKVVEELYAIMEVVADRAEMHKNIGEQRDNWNHLLLTSINGMTVTAATMAGLAAMCGGDGAPFLALKLSSSLLYVASTAVLMVMSKIQPSQLAEEQRNASRLCKQLHGEIKSIIALRKPTSTDVNDAIEKVLSLDRAYPLPLLGTMLNKFPKKVEPAVWWPKHMEEREKQRRPVGRVGKNGWSVKLEEEMREVSAVLKEKDTAEYLKLGKVVLMVSKVLAISGPLFTGLGAVGSAFVGSPWLSSWPVFMGVVCGALATVVNTLEHGGQVGMVFEMYRDSAGFFRLMEENIESTLRERNMEMRENGEVFEAKVALELGRSLSELRDLASATSSSSSARNSEAKQEFASKLF